VVDAIARQDADGAAAAVRALFAPLLATLDSMLAPS
jgi:DNA-binding GntR family transcriptional regulator